MIGYNLERFANSPANLKHVTLYFDNWWTKMGHCQRNGKLKLKLVHPEKKIKSL